MTQPIDASAIAQNISDSGNSGMPAAPNPDSEAQETTEIVEQQSEPVENKPDEDPDFVRRFNALSRRERELLQREQAIKDRYSEYEEYQKERQSIKDNPIGFLEKNGWGFKELADFVLNDQKKSPDHQVSELQRRINELEQERKREIEEREQREARKKAEETTNNFKKSIKETVSSNTEQYELINHFGEYDTVYDVIENYYNDNGVILDVKKAADEVEKYLEQTIEKAASTSKFKKRFSQLTEPSTSEPEGKPEFTPRNEAPQSPRTLTNESVADSGKPSEPASTYLSDEESMKRSAELIREHFLKKQGYSK